MFSSLALKIQIAQLIEIFSIFCFFPYIVLALQVLLFPVRQLAEKHVFETEIELGNQKKRVRYECEPNLGFKRRWKVISSKEKSMWLRVCSIVF